MITTQLRNIPIITILKSLILSILIFESVDLTALTPENFEDTIFYHVDESKYHETNEDQDLAKKQDFVSLFNVMSHSVFDGLLINGAKTGLGTDVLIGKQLETDSSYYQLLRIVSTFDWDFMRGLSLIDRSNLPGHFMISWGRLPVSLVNSYETDKSRSWHKLKSATELMFPEFGTFELRKADSKLLEKSTESRVRLSPVFMRGLHSGILSKYENIDQYAAKNDHDDAVKKLDSLLMAYSPLAGVLEADFQKTQDGNFMKATIFLPPMYQLDTQVDEDPLTWSVKKGMKKFAIKPKPVDISIGRLTHLSYLQGVDARPQHTIRFEISKDLSNKNAITTSTSFGRIETQSGAFTKFTHANPDDGFVVHWHPNIPENFLTEGLSQELRQIEMKAIIQRLNLVLLRENSSDFEKESKKDNLLNPKYVSKTILDNDFKNIAPDIDGSIIYFKAKRVFAKGYKVGFMPGIQFYKMLGFECEERNQVICIQEFTTDDSLGDSVFQQAKNFFAKRLTRIVVGFIIPDIEDALDQHLAHIIDEIVDEIDDFQIKVSDKIRKGIFRSR